MTVCILLDESVLVVALTRTTVPASYHSRFLYAIMRTCTCVYMNICVCVCLYVAFGCVCLSFVYMRIQSSMVVSCFFSFPCFCGKRKFFGTAITRSAFAFACGYGRVRHNYLASLFGHIHARIRLKMVLVGTHTPLPKSCLII